ncbi:MAG: hypothetical protein WB973_20210 [Thermoanaerobaculia bacterium]
MEAHEIEDRVPKKTSRAATWPYTEHFTAERTDSSALTSPAAVAIDRVGAEGLRPRSSAIEDSVGLIQAVRCNPKLSRIAALESADRRDPQVKKIREQIFTAGSSILVQLYRDLFAKDDAERVLRLAERRQQPSSLFLPIDASRSPIEVAICAISDLLAETKDPCHPSMKSERQCGIFRRPYDAMPLIFPNGHFRTEGTFFADVDRLAWEWIPITLFTLTSPDGEEYEEATPATDAAGNVAARIFYLWRGIALSTAYKHGERKAPTPKGRQTKKHASVPGLHEVDGHLVVHIPTYLAERLERKTTHWSRKAAAGPSLAVVTTNEQLTRTEKFLIQLQSEGADTVYLREEWANQIAEERRLGIYG